MAYKDRSNTQTKYDWKQVGWVLFGILAFSLLAMFLAQKSFEKPTTAIYTATQT